MSLNAPARMLYGSPLSRPKFASFVLIYAQTGGATPDIVTELKAITDPAAADYVPILLLEETDNYARTQQGLADVFDEPQVTDSEANMSS